MQNSSDQVTLKLKQENKKLKETLAQKDEKFNKMVRKKDKELVRKDKELVRKDKELVRKDKELVRKDKELVRKDKELVRKDKELVRKDKELDIERRLWKNRAADWNSDDSTDLHRIEVFDGIISDESSLYSATLKTREKFQYILEHAGVYVTASSKTRLFRDDESRASDPGNRCKLRLRHAILMALIHKKDNPTQGVLQAIFGIDQTSVCRYLKVTDQILAKILPTANNISKEIASCNTQEEFKKIIPGQGGGDITIDGTHCPVQRPSEKTVRRMRYSGKKKRFTNNTHICINAEEVIIAISKSTVGSTHDITLLKESPMPFGKWTESMKDASTPEEDRIRHWADKGYQGMAKEMPGATIMTPFKISKKHPTLTAEQKEHNRRVNTTRMPVEHVIGRLKRYDRLVDPYDGTISEFNDEFNVITGLVNLDRLWDKIDRGPPPPGRWETVIDWNKAAPPASSSTF